MWRLNIPRSVAAADRRRRPARLGASERLEPRLALAADPLPFVQSISLAGPGETAYSLVWNVAFSEPVTGVDAADFALALSGVKATTPLAVSGSGAAYTVTANGIAGTGTIGLDLVDDGSIRDLAGNPLCKPGEVSFATPARPLPVGSGPISVAAADVNGDAKPDLVAANYFGNSVSVLLGKGDGTFQPPSQTACGAAPYALAVGDFNGDGKPDLATANYFGKSASVLLGRGDGTFSPAQSFATGSHPVSIAVGLFDADTTLDLAVTNNDDATLGILLGKGDGTFAAQQTFATEGNSAAGVVGDFNGDAKADVVMSYYGINAVGVMLGQGDGTFLLQQPLYAANGNPWGVAVGDINADTRLDIVTGNTSSSTLTAMLGNGGGGFLRLVPDLAAGANPLAVVVGDANADGRADIIVTNTASNTLGILLGNGDGSFRPQRGFATGKGARSAVVADFDGDHKPDVVTANFSGNTLGVLLGNQSGGFVGAVAKIDTVAPSLAITSSSSTLRAGRTATIAFTLSETSTTFTLADVVATGGTLSAFTGSGRSYRATFTPAADSTVSGTVSVAAGTFTDQAGNANLAASLSPPLTIDTVLPTVMITSNATSLAPGRTTTVTFTLSKPTRGFSLAAVAATGGRLSNFKTVSSTVYTATFTAGANTAIKGRIAIAAGRFTDVAGNSNVAASLASPITITR